jgi:hypothetical protein
MAKFARFTETEDGVEGVWVNLDSVVTIRQAASEKGWILSLAGGATPLHVTPRESELEGVFRSLTEIKDGVRTRVFVNPDYVVTIRDPEVASEEGCILSLAAGASPLHVLQKAHMVAEWFN